MLNMIKSMINEKQDFLEAAELILEGELNNFDDAIILGEESELPEPIVEEDDVESEENENSVSEDEEEKNDDTKDIIDEPVNDETPTVAENDDIMNEPLPNDDDDSNNDISSPVENPVTEPISNNDINDNITEPTEQPMPIPGNDLPEPVSNVTGEPVADDNILTMELDLASNTPKDILPVPPASAGDAVVSDDLMDQRIDSGFSDNINEVDKELSNESDDIKNQLEKENDKGLNESSIDVKNISMDKIKELIESSNGKINTFGELLEAITLADAPSEGSDTSTETDSTSTEEVPADEPAAEDNTVTAAVKDKVAEVETDTSNEVPGASKEELMKKLSNITKNLEDAKNAIMKSIQ